MLRAVCPLAAEGLQAPGTHPSASHSQKATLRVGAAGPLHVQSVLSGDSQEIPPQSTLLIQTTR